MATAALTRRQLNRATLARQMLLARADLGVARATERLVALQAQLARPPHIGLWSRLERYRRDDLARLCRRREVVRGTLLRATLHLVTARDYLTVRPAIQPALSAALGRRRPGDGDLARALRVARELFARAPATFDTLRAHLRERFPGADERALAYAVRTHLPLVQVPTEAPWGYPGNADFTLAEPWLDARVPDTASPHALILRYLAALGPASVADAQTWSGLARLGPVFEELQPRLRVFHDERGRVLYDLPRAPRPPDDVPAPPRFLPEYDNLLLGHADRTRVIPEEHRRRLIGPNLTVPATFLVDGFVAGAWRVVRRGPTATLVLEPFERLAKSARAALVEESERLLRFVEEDARTFAVRWGAAHPPVI